MLAHQLARTRLAADEALAPYPFRWSAERMYSDLEAMLNLNRVYAANPQRGRMQSTRAGSSTTLCEWRRVRPPRSSGSRLNEISPAKSPPGVAVAC